jgi:cytoskeletal protein CcmA (bactofilin family)
MGTGYTRNDTANNIADGNIINASDFDGEFDAIVTAFSTSGHTHDGTEAEGGAITKLGPAQQLTIAATSIVPSTDDAFDLGSSGAEFKDLYIDGVAYIDAINFNGTAIASTAAELNIVDGDTSASTGVTIATSDQFIINDGGTMKQLTFADLETWVESNIDTGASLTTVGALDSGSITSGFGNIDNGSSTITTTGLISGGSLDIDDVLINGSTIGHTDDTDLITLADGVVTVAGELDAVSLDVSGNVDIDGTLEADAITVDGTALNEFIADTIGAMVTSNTETGITVTYEDGDNTLDFVIGTLNQDTTGTAAIATAITVTANNSTDETVYPVFVDGATGTQGAETDSGLSYNPSSGNFTIGGALTAASLDISGDVDVDGTLEADAITVNGTTLAETIADTVGAMVSSNTESGITVAYQDADNTLDFTVGTLNQDTTGTAAIATAITVTANNSTDETVYPIFVDGATGTQGAETDTGLSYNPSTGLLTTAGVTASGTVTYGSLSDGAITVTAFVDEDNMSSDSATLIPTQQSVKAYVDNSMVSLLATDIKIGEDDETKIDFETADEIHFYAANVEQVYLADNIFGPQTDSDVDLGTTGVRWKDAYVDSVTVTDNVTVGGTLTVNGTTTTVNSTTVTIDDPIFTLGGDTAPGTDDNKDRGIEFRYHTGSAAKVGFFGYDDSTSAFTFIPDATNSSEVFSGTAGNVAFGNIAGTLTTAAQTNITSVGALDGGSISSGFGAIDTGSSNITTTGLISGGSLDIDNVLINGTTIGHTDDTDLMTLANGVLTVAGEVSMTTLDIGGTNVTATAAELNYTGGVTSNIQTQLDARASTGKAIAMAMVFG